MNHISDVISKACLIIAGIALCLISIIIMWQVFARYVLSDSPSWSEQLALYLMIWMIFLAAAAGIREQFHIRITVLQDGLAPRSSRLLQMICHAVTIAIGIVMLFAGIRLVAGTWGYQIPTLGLPRGSSFIPIPLCGFLISYFSLEHIIALARMPIEREAE